MADYNLDADNVQVGITGGIFIGPELTAVPTGFVENAPTGFKPFGYLGEDAISINDGTTETPLRAWQNRDTVRKLKDASEVEITFNAIEGKNTVVKEAFYGRVADADGGYLFDGSTGGRKALYIYVEDEGANIVDLYVFFSVEKNVGGERSISGTEANGYPFTYTAYRKFDGFYKHYSAPLTSGS